MKNTLLLLFWLSATSILSAQADRNSCEDDTKEDYKKSVQQYKSIINIDSSDLHAYYKLGMSYYKLQDYNRAVSVFDILIEKDNCYNAALHNRAFSKYFLKDKVGACLDFERALACKNASRKQTKKDYKQLCKE